MNFTIDALSNPCDSCSKCLMKSCKDWNIVKRNEMTRVSFTVFSKTAQIIGQENFSTADGAIVEL